MELNKLELDIAKEIINIGLGKAGDSMAFFTQEKVILQSLELSIKNVDEINTFSERDTNEDTIVLTTDLIGELNGVCFLLFSEKDAEKIYNVALPEEIRNNPDKLRVMGDAILLEMDNIIAASVITQFSNIFKYKVHGGVPGINRIKARQLTETIKSSSKCPPYMLYFRSNFNTHNLAITPEFIWLLDESFIAGVRKLAEEENILELLKSKK